MRKPAKAIGYVILVAALGFILGAYGLAPGFWQSLLLGLGTTLIGLGLAVLVVNHLLTSADKRAAAKPLAKLILPHVRKLHNDLFIEHGRQTFGRDRFESLIDLYQKHQRDPIAFAPEDRQALYAAIEAEKDDLSRVFDTLNEQLRELMILLGWSFDAQIVATAMEARLNYATFRAITWDGTEDTQRTAIESFFDAEGATSAVLSRLLDHLGMAKADWLGS